MYGNGQMDNTFMILKKKMDPRGRSATIPGQYTCIRGASKKFEDFLNNFYN